MDCTTVAANERRDRTGCCCLSSEADLMPNFEIVICVYNWDVSCEDSVYLRSVYLNRMCATCIGNQSLFFGLSPRYSSIQKIQSYFRVLQK